ncbi:serine hydrolase [Candidatus Gottesmanbacteria bacterium]|nr:serine hydrolase [Candidatus Gottesmanbacteria bacterium]
MRHARPVIMLFILTVITGGALVVLPRAMTPAVISPLAEEPQPAFSFPKFFFRNKDPDELRKKIQTVIGNSWKNYSVYVKDYTSNFVMGINEPIIFTAASVNKIPILASLYYGVQNGEINLDQSVTLQESDIQDYGTGTIRYDPPGTVYSVKTLARLMMQQSDNTAAYILANYVIGLDTIQTLITKWGLTQTDMANNKTSNKDTELLLSKIVQGKVANSAYTQEMLAFLKDSDFEDRLPALLPKDATVYHKTGNGAGVVHDAGIVRAGRTNYYIGILAGDVTDEEGAAKMIANISKLVFDYLR